MATKSEEADYLLGQLHAQGVTARLIDISLDNGGRILDGAAKARAMEAAADHARSQISAASHTDVVLGIGGGTGGEIVLQILRALPITFPKVMVTTLPFDPRIAVADNSIIILPTLADINGLNAMLRDVLQNAAAVTAGLCRKTRKGELKDVAPSVGITALGATDGLIAPLVRALRAEGRESTVFHANGYGGAAFARFADAGAFNAIIEATPHELTRLHIAGVHADLTHRFSAGNHLPRVVLPGALNFIGLGQIDLVPETYLKRPHYAHSGLFTHAKVTVDEMKMLAGLLADAMNAAKGYQALIVPMGGFSHQDRPGGQIEDPPLRDAFLTSMRAALKTDIQITPVDAHISDPEVAETTLKTLSEITP